MIYLYISIVAILIGYFVVQKHKKETISKVSECHICNQTFAEKDIFVTDDLPFCQDHYYVYKNNDWDLYQEVKSNADSPEDGVKLYEYKIQLFHKEGIPSIIKSDYSIDGNSISTILKLYIHKEDLNRIKKGLVN